MDENYEQLAALVPCYGPSGDTTLLISRTGETCTQEKSLSSVLRRLLRQKAIDLPSLRLRTAIPGRRPVLQPLPLSPGLLLCPLKLRLPKIPGDNCTGYVNVHAVEKISSLNEAPYRSQIHFSCGRRLPVIWTSNTVNRHLYTARLCQQRFTPQPQNLPDLLPTAQKLAEIIYELLLYRPLTSDSSPSLKPQSHKVHKDNFSPW